jgi:hypothetical protein
MNAWLLAAALTIPSGHQEAPVYTILSESILKRTGTFYYKPSQEGYTILFCITKTPVTLRCAVSTPNDLVVIIEAQATEQAS